ncbi:pilus assembly PilX family protein [Crenobacter luteus]|uniref:pilus assembly PilX family protein n=1 Tax=Crenobacter luteus TaxID=1452487 RepID=UPI001E46A26B|nr:PilX N-terminal domain-containing pilus assembly protein [Crenobacter luteus]
MTRLRARRRARGSTLFAVLILVVGLALLSLAGGVSSLLEEKVARGQRDGSLAFQYAERVPSELLFLQALDATSPLAVARMQAASGVATLPDCARYGVSAYTPPAAVAGVCLSQAGGGAPERSSLLEQRRGSEALIKALQRTPPAALAGLAGTLPLPASALATSEGTLPAPRYFVEVIEKADSDRCGASTELSGALSAQTSANEVPQYRVTARGFAPDRSDGAHEPVSRTIETTICFQDPE